MRFNFPFERGLFMKYSAPSRCYETSFSPVESHEMVIFCPAVHKFEPKQIHYINDLQKADGFYQIIDLQDAARQFELSVKK